LPKRVVAPKVGVTRQNTDMSQQTKREVLVKLRRACARARSLYKRQLLDQAVALFDYHRKPPRKPCTPRSTLSNFWFRVLGFEFWGRRGHPSLAKFGSLKAQEIGLKDCAATGAKDGRAPAGVAFLRFQKKGSTG
jgi:hypothetical protein